MSENAVSIDRLSKLYNIGAIRDLRSFREVVTDAFLFRRSRRSATDRQLWALRDVSFQVRRGEAIGIIGQNGAGKSTLLKILSRITEPSSGRVELRGRVSSLLEVGTGFHAELTGRENISLNGAILGMSRAEIKSRFDEIVAFAEVERFIDTPVKYYSSGMYMRLAFAVAAHLEQEILIVDEVLAVGDASFQSKCLRKMGDAAHSGRTVLFVSHNMTAVRTLCEAAVWLKGGQVVEIGRAEEVVNHYLQEAASATALGEVQATIDALPDDPVFRLRAVAVRQRGVDTQVLMAGDVTEITVEFEVFRRTKGLHVYLSVLDLDDLLVFESLHNGDLDEPPLVEAGHYTATALIPADLLAPRPYQLSINASIANERHVLPDPIRIAVDVQPSGVVNRAYPGYVTPGRLAPHIQWSIRHV